MYIVLLKIPTGSIVTIPGAATDLHSDLTEARLSDFAPYFFLTPSLADGAFPPSCSFVAVTRIFGLTRRLQDTANLRVN